MGVMLFMMLIGAPPFPMPSPQNHAFNFIVNGRLKDVLKHWKRLRLLNEEALDLLNKIFVYESKRISMDEILKHPFVNLAESKKKIETEQHEKQSTKTEDKTTTNKDEQQQQQQPTPQPKPSNEKAAPPVQTTQQSAENKEIEDIRTHTFKSEMAQSFADRLKVDSLPMEQLKAIMEDVEKAHSPLNKQPKNTNDKSFAEIKCEIEAIHRYLEKQMAAQQASSSSSPSSSSSGQQQQQKHKVERLNAAVNE